MPGAVIVMRLPCRKRKRAAPVAPPVFDWSESSGDLEHVTKAELDNARSVHVRSDVSKGTWDQESSGSRIAKVWMVENVDRVDAKLKLVAVRPGHLEIFQKRCVEIPQAGSAYDVAVARTAGDRECECAVRVRLIRKVLNRRGCASAPSHLVDPGFDIRARPDENRRLRLREVDRECARIDLERGTAIGRKNTGPFPSADEFVDQLRRVVAELLSGPERQPVLVVHRNHVPVVEVGAAAAYPEVAEVANFRSREVDQVVLHAGVIVD